MSISDIIPRTELPVTETYENDGNINRFVTIDKSGRAHHAIQGGLPGETVNYVRVDFFGSLDELSIHEVICIRDDKLYYQPTPRNLEVTYS